MAAGKVKQEIMKSINQKINNFDDRNYDDNDYDYKDDDGYDEVEDMYIEADYFKETEYVRKEDKKDQMDNVKITNVNDL